MPKKTPKKSVKKPVKKASAARKPKPLAHAQKNEPLRLTDLTQADQVSAVQAVNEPYKNATSILTNRAAKQLASPKKEQRTVGRRNARTAKLAVDRAVPFKEMVNNRVEMFLKAATTHRMEGEPYAGAYFYYKNNALIKDAIKDTSVSYDSALDAVGALSAQVKPGPEKVALKALIQAQDRGSVNFNPDLISGLAAVGHTVPQEMHDKDVPWSDVPSKTASELVHPDIRDIAIQSVTDIDIPGISQVHKRRNIEQSIDAMRSPAEAPDPYDNPKKWSYRKSHQQSVGSTRDYTDPVQVEYMSRAEMAGQAGRNPGQYQDAFDFYDLRQSNEGILSDENHSAEDSWQRAVTLDKQDRRAKKAMADALTMTSKTVTKRGGKKVTIRDGDTTVTPAGIEHAVNNAATSQAAKELKDRLGVHFPIPTVMVQEGGWAAVRRDSPEKVTQNAAGELRASASSQDPAWDEYVAEKAHNSSPKRRSGSFAQGTGDPQIPGQLSLF
jgi:hypothetical protein